MTFLLDTNVISELTKKIPDPGVLSWFNQAPEERMYISVISLGEINRGIEKLTEGKKKNDLLLWFDQLQEVFRFQTITLDEQMALKWGELSAKSEKNGKVLPVLDGFIAAASYIKGAILVTRNTEDFSSLPIQTLNPWL